MFRCFLYKKTFRLYYNISRFFQELLCANWSTQLILIIQLELRSRVDCYCVGIGHWKLGIRLNFDQARKWPNFVFWRFFKSLMKYKNLPGLKQALLRDATNLCHKQLFKKISGSADIWKSNQVVIQCSSPSFTVWVTVRSKSSKQEHLKFSSFEAKYWQEFWRLYTIYSSFVLTRDTKLLFTKFMVEIFSVGLFRV